MRFKIIAKIHIKKTQLIYIDGFERYRKTEPVFSLPK